MFAVAACVLFGATIPSMATVKTVSTAEAMRMADETASRQLERICKEMASVSEQYRSSGLEDIQRMQREAEKLGYGVAPLIRDLEQQMATFNLGIAERLRDVAVSEVKMPTDLAFLDKIAAIENPLSNISSFPIDSMLDAVKPPTDLSTFAPPDVVTKLPSVTSRFAHFADVVEESMEHLGERVEQRLKADAAASQAQMLQVGNMIEALVKITTAASRESAAATKRNTRLAIIMTIAAICQCLIPLLMRYLLK